MAASTSPELSAGKLRRRSGIVLWCVLIVLLLAAFIPPWINVSRYRNRASQAISQALGRHVSASGISMRLVPRPGLVLSNFVVADDPLFGPEDMLRADTVTAYLRLSSLWRGRLEIGTLELDNPSLNLVRRSDGHWNLEELIQRTAQVSSAPTAAPRPQSRPRFPYIEATGGRINFKFGEVKKSFSFTDADFSLWQESESEWGLRLRAKPMRTDLALSDTGLLKLDGRFQRADQLRDTPVVLKVDYTKGQLGQITKLIYGRDRGWRGGATISATLTGTPATLGVVLDAQVDDFRRYDISLGESLRLRAHCTGTYSSQGDTLTDMVCESPINPGVLRVSGNAADWGADSYQIAITAQQVPMDRIVAFARHSKKDLPPDLNATGEADVAFEVRKSADKPVSWSGGGRATQLALHSGVLGKELQIGDLEFAVPGNAVAKPAPHGRHKKPQPQVALATGFTLVVKPFSLPMGDVSPAIAGGYVDEENYRATINGPAELTRLVQVARALGIGTPGIGLAGKAEVELQLAGTWAGFSAPTTSGQLQIQGVTAELQGVNEPLHIDSAKASLSNQKVSVSSFSASFATGPTVTGSASFPVHCTSPETCIAHFDLHTNELSLARVNQLLNPAARSQPWYHLLAIWQQHQDALLKLHADGDFDVTHFQLGRLQADNLHGQVKMDAGKVTLDILRSDLLGGHHNGHWTGDFTVSPPRFEGGGGLQKVSMDQLSTLMHDNWATGQAAGRYAIVMQGKEAASLRDSVTGSLDFTWTGGSLRHITLQGHPAPASFSSLAGVLQIGKGKLAFDNCKLKMNGSEYDVTGTAAYDTSLNLKLQPATGTGYTVAGSIDKPRVEALPASPSEAKMQ